MKVKLQAACSVLAFLFCVCGIAPLYSRTISGSSDTLIRINVNLNGTLLQDSLYLYLSSEGALAEAKHFMHLIGGQFYPLSTVFSPRGMMLQYGKIISFTGLEFEIGFCNCVEVDMVPLATSLFINGDSVYMAPLRFLSESIGGTVSYDIIANILSVDVDPPSQFGSITPDAAPIAEAFQDSGFFVQQGGISHANAIQFCAAGYVPNCNGNNASFPYFIIQMPPPAGVDSPYAIPILYNFKQDEAVVAIGKTPPECKYFSYRSYLVNRLYTLPTPDRIKIYASLGDTKSLYTMREDKPLDSMFQRKVAFIMAADSLIATSVKGTILAVTKDIAEEDVYFDIVPHDVFRLGTDIYADMGNFLHRASLFSDTASGNQYMKNPTLEILRLTPAEPTVPDFFTTPGLRSRTSGTNEFTLFPDVGLLEERIWDTCSPDYNMIWLQPGIWLIEGYPAIQERVDVLGEVRDALYMSSSCFSFKENDVVVVYGVDHTKTGKAVYTNVSCYGEKYKNGFGGITNKHLQKTARQYISDTTVADHLFAYKFSRHPISRDTNVFIVPSDTLSNLMGINVNDTAFMAFRAYIDTITKVGPDEKEVILDRAVLLRPLNPGIHEISTGHPEAVMRIFPNPVIDMATVEITVPGWSDISLTLYDQNGRQIGSAWRMGHVRNTVMQEMRLSGDLPAGVYYIRAVILGQGKPGAYTLSSRIVKLDESR